jgi:hypothetical protein
MLYISWLPLKYTRGSKKNLGGKAEKYTTQAPERTVRNEDGREIVVVEQED